MVEPGGPPCGFGHLETFASGSGMVARARDALTREDDQARASVLDLESLTTRAVFEAADNGDGLAAAVIRKAVIALGYALANYVNTNNPEAIVLGGGVAQSSGDFVAAVEAEMRSQALSEPGAAVQVTRASLGGDAGTIGAALLVMDHWIKR